MQAYVTAIVHSFPMRKLDLSLVSTAQQSGLAQLWADHIPTEDAMRLHRGLECLEGSSAFVFLVIYGHFDV
jgi:hypothetical protein